MTAINQSLFAFLVAPSDLGGIALALSVMLAEWAILVGPGLLVLLWLFGERTDREAGVAAAFAGVVALALASVVSGSIVVPRPFMDGAAVNYLDHTPDSGFPSDHCSLLFALSFALLLWRPAGVPRLWIGLAVISLAVGWARVFLGAHYPLDIAGAALVAAASTLIVSSPWGRALVHVATLGGERIFGVLTRSRAA